MVRRNIDVQQELITWAKQGMEKTHTSQVELAERSGVSLKHVNGVLNGKAKASVPVWQRLIDAAWNKETHLDDNGIASLRPD